MMIQRASVILISLLFTQDGIALVKIHYEVLQGYIVTGVWTTNNKFDGAISCCVECAGRTNCIAVNYHKVESLCEFIESSDNNTLQNLEEAPEWTLYYVDLSAIDPMSIATAEQSSTLANKYHAYKAIDGIYNGYIRVSGGNQCAHTENGTGQWWMIDVKLPFPLQGVTIWNRQDCCATRLNSLLITVSPTLTGIDDTDSVCAFYPGPPSPLSSNPIVIHCDRVMRGRYLKIAKQHSEGVLTLCEVEVVVA